MRGPERLDADQERTLSRDGFVVVRAFLPDGISRRLIAETDAHIADPRARPAFTFPTHGALTSHPPLMALMEQLLGPGFLFHHVHASRHDTGAPGVAWHNDYEQVPQLSRSHRDLIVLVYPAGLRGEVGDLVVVPGTQGIVSDWYQLSCFGTATLPGEVVIDDLEPGSIVIADAGLLHCRRPRPGAGPRYFSDFSYCQAGIRWPSWSEGDWRAMYRHLLAADRSGRGAHLYDASRCFDQREARARLEALVASGRGCPGIDAG
jgi:hypothetical protein